MKINVIIPGVSLTGGLRVIFKYGELMSENNDVVFYSPIIPFDVHKSCFFVNKLRVVWNFIKNIIVFGIRKEHLHTSYNVDVKIVPIVSNCFIRNADITIATAWPTACSVNKLNENRGKKVYFIQDYEIWNNKELCEKTYFYDFTKIVISKQIADRITLLTSKNDCYLLYDGIDLKDYKCEKKIYKDDYTSSTFLMLFHHLPKKGVKNGVEVFRRVKTIYPNIKLIMFGMDEDPNFDFEYTYYQNPDRNLLRQLYESADIFIFPSIEEGWGLTPIEAMSAKCVVVGTNVGCLYDFKGEDIAKVSEPNDIDAMFENVIGLINHPGEIKCLAERAFSFVKRFSWKESGNRFEEILKGVVDEIKN